MNEFTKSIKKVFAGSMKSFKDFPLTILSAFGFLLVMLVKIQMDWEVQETYDFLLNCLQWSFALSSVFSLMVITLAHSRFNTKKAFILANILGVISIIVTFIILYFSPAINLSFTRSSHQVISAIGITRLIVIMLVSYLVFIVLTARSFDRLESDKKDLTILNLNFSRALFMNHKALFTALIYGLVIVAGSSGVAGAIQGLLYQDMSSKVYMYIGAITSFIVFTIFVGYFPDLRQEANDEQRQEAETQPRFVEILFGYIMVPIMIALTVVLLLWTSRVIITRVDVPFEMLASIAAAYTVIGIWLHMMVSEHNTQLTRFYRKFYPIPASIILIFEASVIIKQLGQSGLKLSEYWFIMVWIVAFGGAVLIFSLKERSYILIVGIICSLAIVSILPYMGYNDLPVIAQTNRLERLLTKANMLEDGSLVPAKDEPDYETREKITDSVNYLIYDSDAKLPSWLDDSIINDYTFKDMFGFEKTWPKSDYQEQPTEHKSISLYLPLVSIDISDYNLAVSMGQGFEKEQDIIGLEGQLGRYKIDWNYYYDGKAPTIEIILNDETIIQEDLAEYIEHIKFKYPYENMQYKAADYEDMSLVLESEELKVLLVFRSLDFNLGTKSNGANYMINLETIYIIEKDK